VPSCRPSPASVFINREGTPPSSSRASTTSGYSSIKERTHETSIDPTPFDRLLRVLYYSVWSYLVLALFAIACKIDLDRLTELFNDHKDDPAQLVWRGALAVLVPSAIIATAGRLWDSSGLQAWFREQLRINLRHTVPTAWDHFFSGREPALVRVTLKDGGVVAGFYGERSFAAYSKDGRDPLLGAALEARPGPMVRGLRAGVDRCVDHRRGERRGRVLHLARCPRTRRLRGRAAARSRRAGIRRLR
jgi:Family of unknown function (DUF6338)